ncbi:reverse transcriptase domain-containing protein [Tanacetum coccineum]|uniref:Reverse transcriptase domain-containing protein n=1 Tax=Tanacetum coccineum TaxID=301880 RepID=A0ABQ5CI26_9ASTR
MRTRSQARRRRQPQVRQTSVESSNLEKPDNPPIVTMADNRTMAQLLEAPTEGYEDAIVIPEITANNFEIKHGLLNLVQNKQFFGNDKEDPHAHIRYFNKITSTRRFRNATNTSVKLMLFPFSLEGAARIWLEKEPPRSIETWDDLVSKFINKFFPPSKTTNLRNEITRFQQKFDETFYEAWDRFNDLLRGCPHHGFSELHQLDTFYNALNSVDQDSLNSAAGGPKAVNHDAEVTKDTMPPANNGSTEDVQPPFLKAFNSIPSEENDEGRKEEKANDQIEKFYEIFRDLSFEISFTDALMLMPKFASTLKTLIGNKEKLSELARTPLNENCSAVILNKLPKKLGGTCEDVFVNVGKFQFPADFVVVDFEPDPRVPLILGRCFLKTSHALIDVYEGEITLRVGKEAITFNLDQTSRYTADYNTYDVAIPLRYFEPIVSTASPNLTPFGDSDFLLIEEADSFLALEDDPTSSEVDPTYQDPEGDILLLEAILNRFLVGATVDPVIIAKDLKDEEKAALLKVLKSHKRAIAWKLSDIKGVSPEFSLGKSVHCVLRQGSMTVITNDENELIPTRLVTGWRETNTTVSSMASRVIFRSQLTQKIKKDKLTCPYGTFAYRRMPFGLCNAPGTFQRCMMAIFHDMIEKMMEVFMDDFSVFGDSFSTCLSHLEKMLKRCEDTNLSLNWEKSHFMVKEGIVLGHKISKSGLEVDRAKVEVIAKLPHPTTVKGVRSFLGHAGFYRRFIQDFSKIVPSMTISLEKETPFFFSEECIDSFNTLKRKLTKALILIAHRNGNWPVE